MKRKRYHKNPIPQPHWPQQNQIRLQTRPHMQQNGFVNHAYPSHGNYHQPQQHPFPQVNRQQIRHRRDQRYPKRTLASRGQKNESEVSVVNNNNSSQSVTSNAGKPKDKLVRTNQSSGEASNSDRQLVIQIDDSPEKADNKRRKVITIDSDDETANSCNSAEKISQNPSMTAETDLPESSTSGRSIPKKYCDHLTSSIFKYYVEHKQDERLFERKQSLRDGIQELVNQNFGEGLLHLTGSSMSGFGTTKSDADMALIFNPNLSEMSKKKSRTIIARLASCLRRQAYCSNVETIFAKVPIVKFFDNISQCDVDININNIVGIKNSFLLKSVSLVDNRIPPLVLVIKQWAKSHNINSAFQGSLSSYCLVAMIIYFLQTGLSPPLLPPLKTYVDSLEKINVNTGLQKLIPKSFIKFDVRNKEELGNIFVEFFHFWTKKFRQNKIFSLYSAKETIRSYNQPFLDTNAYVLVVEEPFQKDNIARAVRGQQFGEVKSKFNKACEEFKDITAFNKLFGEH